MAPGPGKNEEEECARKQINKDSLPVEPLCPEAPSKEKSEDKKPERLGDNGYGTNMKRVLEADVALAPDKEGPDEDISDEVGAVRDRVDGIGH